MPFPKPQVYSRAVVVATKLGGFIARVAQDFALGTVDKNLTLRAQQLVKVLTDLG